MPYLTKQVISNYLRSECRRRLRLDLSPDNQRYRAERTAQAMPPEAVGRPGLRALAAAGTEWEESKLNDLVQTLGTAALIGNSARTPTGSLRFSETPLSDVIGRAAPGTFIVQGEYDLGPGFEAALGIAALRTAHALDYGQLRPDLIQVLTPGTQFHAVRPDGTIIDVPQGDQRLPLRVIEIKLTAEPSVPYFVEVTYYSMALAAWLADHQLGNRFFVVPEAAVWPGSHEASAVVRFQSECQAQGITPTSTQLLQALAGDLEIGEFSVFAPRLRRFFQEELAAVLGEPWRQLEWHVDNRCIGCEYLGYPWPGTTPNPDHCWPMANTQDHLSRVAFVSRGARNALEENQIGSVAALAGTQPGNAAFDSHHVLRATRTVVAGRAQSLTTGQAAVPPQAGTSAVMPRWTDLRIYLTADFDIGSGITMAFGFKAVWGVAQNRVQQGQEHFHVWQAQAFPIDQRDPAVEQRELLRLLAAVDQALRFATATIPTATVQVYVWDSLTYDHLVRVIGRHLTSIIQNRLLSRLAWLFPPDTLVANPDISDRYCPITVIRDVMRAVIAAPVPHYYSLLSVAREYHSARTQPPYDRFDVPTFFEDPLSDQVPSERAHEIWSRATGARPWNIQLRSLEQTVRVKLNAIESIADRLGADLQGQLNQTAPRITDLRPPRLPQRMADDARLWSVFARLNVALEELETEKTQAMPPHEREARFRSAWLTNRLTGPAAQQILTRFGLQLAAHRLVYTIRPGSREVKAREGDFSFALAPASEPGFLGRRIRTVAGAVQLPLPGNNDEWKPMEYVTGVSVRAIDRDAGHIVLDLNTTWAPVFFALEQSGVVNFSTDVMLDPVHKDFFTPRLDRTLNAIGNPAIAIAHPGVGQAIGRARRATAGAVSPVADVYWNAPALFGSLVQRDLPPIRTLLATSPDFDLNLSQWQAWQESLTHRLRLIWGPPGTGKSRTLRTIVMGALHEASRQGRPMRVLVTGPTYEAIDNVLLGVARALMGTGPLAIQQATIARLRSTTRPPDPAVPQQVDVPTDFTNQAFQQLRGRLQQAQGLTLIGATVHQAYRLTDSAGRPVQEFFDLIIVDEASQMDVATSTLALAGLAAGGSVVVAGDPQQLPPIHQAEPPTGLEHMVGPLFTYFRDRHNLAPLVLDVNYRSCSTIVELAHTANYPRTLQAYSPDLRIEVTTPIPAAVAAPQGWPPGLLWTPEWAALLDPAQPATCFIYREGRSSQWNQFEADAVASLVWLLANRVGDHLVNERIAPAGNIQPTIGLPYSMPDFWNKAIGVVTPHRAQQALIVNRLQSLFPGQAGQDIREAVDTVERFQGQQRDVMLATFALGDPDAIGDEDEFLLSLNRFNVMVSRARAKLIVFASQEVVDHMSSDMNVLRQSALLKTFVEPFCNQGRPMILGHMRAAGPHQVPGRFRWR